MYTWQSSLWPDFVYDKESVSEALNDLQYLLGVVVASFNFLSNPSKQLHNAESLSEEIINSSKLENINLNYDSVFSSVIKQLDIDNNQKIKIDKNSESLSKLIIDACNNKSPVTEERILHWHKLLFDGLGKGFTQKNVGRYREEPVYIIHSTYKCQEIIYEAMPYSSVQQEMNRLIDYINYEYTGSSVVKAAITSFWFVTIHPFGDGNGRISRALADYIINKENSSLRYCSISSEILREKKSYYEILQKTQSSENLDITQWILWYINVYKSSLKNAAEIIDRKIRTTIFMSDLDPNQYNSRQLFMLYKLAEGSFYGNLTAEKWMKLTKCKSATPTRDLSELVEKKILIRLGTSGKNFRYLLNSR